MAVVKGHQLFEPFVILTEFAPQTFLSRQRLLNAVWVILDSKLPCLSSILNRHKLPNSIIQDITKCTPNGVSCEVDSS